MKFTDTTASTAALPLSSEAITYNGVCLDAAIPGFRTLNVSGREIAKKAVEDTDNVFDGTYFYRTRYPARTIKVTYQLLSDTPERFRELYNELNKVLNGGIVQVIFADEPDKYWNGTAKDNTDPPAGACNVTGSFEIYCPDPFKYAVTEQSFEGVKRSDGSWLLQIKNGGNFPAEIRYEIDIFSDNGYISLASRLGAIELGKPTEVDSEAVSNSELIMNLDGYDALSTQFEPLGDDPDFPVPNSTHDGTFGKAANGSMIMNSWGNITKNMFHGPCYRYAVPAEFMGLDRYRIEVDFSYKAAGPQETGILYVIAEDRSRRILEKVNINKTFINSRTATVYAAANGSDFTSWQVDACSNSLVNAHMILEKNKGSFNVSINGQNHQVYAGAAADTQLAYILLYIGAWSDYPNRLSTVEIHRMRVWQDYSTWKDIPNHYAAGDRITIDGTQNKVYINGIFRPQEEILGSEYFKAPPGELDVSVHASEWIKKDITVRAFVRERWV